MSKKVWVVTTGELYLVTRRDGFAWATRADDATRFRSHDDATAFAAVKVGGEFEVVGLRM